MMRLAFISYLIITIFTYRFAFASFENTFLGARPAGFANSFTAVSDDINSIYFNPAGLARIHQPESLIQYNMLYQGLDDNSNPVNTTLGLAIPLNESNCVGIGYNSFSVSDLYSETVLAGSYSRTFTSSLALGITGKIFMKKIGGGYNKSKSGMDTDCGVIYNWKKGYYLGAAIRNILQADMTTSNYSDKVPRSITVGVCYREKMFALNFEASIRQQYDTNSVFSVGAEQCFEAKRDVKLGFRGGLMLTAQMQCDVAFGFGYYTKNIGIDYALRYPLVGVGDVLGTHHVGLVLKFRPEKKIKFTEILEDRIVISDRVVRETAMKEYESALEHYRKQVEAGMPLSDQYNLLKTIVIRYKRRGVDVTKHEKELEILEEKLKKDVSKEMKGNSIKLYRSALADYRAGDYIAALDKAREANVLNAEDKSISDLRSKLEALCAVVSRVTGKDKSSVFVRNGVEAYLNNDILKALNWLRYGTEKDPDNVKSIRILDLVESEYPDMATRDRYDPGVGIINQKLQRALECIYDGKYLLTIAECRDVLELEPNNVTALKILGSGFWELGKKTKAVEYWKKALKLNPNDGELREYISGAGVKLPAEKKIKKEAKPRTYVIQKGDTLPKIAQKVYGDKSKWRKIYNANRDKLKTPYSFSVGIKLVIP